MIDFSFFYYMLLGAGMYFLTIDISDIKFCLHIRFCPKGNQKPSIEEGQKIQWSSK
jgi:hypothetical protein